MNKILVIFSLLLISTLCDNRDILQQGLNGAFEQNKLPDPTTIIPCIDEDTAGKIVKFIGSTLDKAAKGSVSDIISLINDVKKFGDQIPQSVKDCLDGNQEFKALGKKYGIDDTSNSTEIEKKVITYITLHYITFHKDLGKLNDEWKAKKYYQTGYDAAVVGHKVLGVDEHEHLPEISDKDILQQFLNGIFEQNKLPDPTTIVPCFDDDSAHKTVVFMGQLLQKAASGSVSDLMNLKTLVQNFTDSLPQSVKDCLNGNEEVKALGLKYGITDQTDPATIEKKVIAYVTLHYLSVHKWLGEINDAWKAGKYYDAGQKGATYAHNILGITEEDIRKIISIE